MSQSDLTTRTSPSLLCRCTVWAVVVLIGLLSVAQTNAQESENGSTESANSVEDPYRVNQLPEVAENIGVDSKTGDMVPMELTFRDTQQRRVEIGSFFTGERPVMMSFNYSDCPKLCSVQLENMTRALKEISGEVKVGEDFEFVSISIDPNEQSVRSRATREKYVELYDQKGTEEGWHFLTGKRSDIAKITDACGFRYRYIARQRYYSHPPVFILISADGKILQYIHGLSYDTEEIKNAIIESKQGDVRGPINWASYGLGCFVFDEATGKYTFQAMAAMRLGGIATVVLLLVTLIPYWFLKRGQNNTSKSGLPRPDAV